MRQTHFGCTNIIFDGYKHTHLCVLLGKLAYFCIEGNYFKQDWVLISTSDIWISEFESIRATELIHFLYNWTKPNLSFFIF
jgi:hypothetical protein